MPVWRTTDNSWELVLSSYHVDSGMNLGIVARQQALLPAEPSCQPGFVFNTLVQKLTYGLEGRTS